MSKKIHASPRVSAFAPTQWTRCRRGRSHFDSGKSGGLSCEHSAVQRQSLPPVSRAKRIRSSCPTAGPTSASGRRCNVRPATAGGATRRTGLIRHGHGDDAGLALQAAGRGRPASPPLARQREARNICWSSGRLVKRASGSRGRAMHRARFPLCPRLRRTWPPTRRKVDARFRIRQNEESVS